MSSIASFFKKVRLPNFSFLEKPTPEVPVLYTDKCTVSTALPSDVHYVTPRLLLMPFPDPDLLPSLALFLNTQFGKRYMIWNLSERTYDNAPFGGQVIDYVFVGYPNPPLDMLFATCTSIQAWLNTDPGNVAVVHCQATRSRSAMTLACFLAWTSQEFPSAMQALVKVCGTVGISEGKLLFPSQKRYMQYSEIILAGTMVSTRQPVSRKLRFERVIITGIPIIEPEGASIRPYIQLFKGTNMIFSSGSEYLLPSPSQIYSYYPSDLSISFDLSTEVEADVLLRCRHLSRDGTRQTLFRVVFHTAFVTDGLLRLQKQDLDYACNDERIPSDLLIDLFFSSVKDTSEETESFWKSVEHQKAVPTSLRVQESPSSRSRSDSEEEKVDHALIENYQEGSEESGGEDEDLSDYLSSLESKGPNKGD